MRIGLFKVKRYKKSVLFTWVISYLITFILPLVICNVVYFEAIRSIKNEINVSNSNALKGIKQRIDIMLSQIDKFSNELMLDKNIQEIAKKDAQFFHKNIYNISNLVLDFNKKKISGSYTDDFDISFPNSNMVIGTSGINESEIFFRNLYGTNKQEYLAWKDTILTKHNSDFLILPKSFEERQKRIVYIKTWQNVENNSVEGSVLININIAQFVESEEWKEMIDKGELLIIDKNDRIIFSSGQSFPTDFIKYNILSKVGDLFEKRVNYENYVVTYISSGVTNWKYVYLLPSQVFWSRLKYINRLIIIGVSVCLILGFIIISIQAKKNYKPINNLVEQLENKVGKACVDEENEYQFIQNVLRKTFNENEYYEDKLSEQDKVLRDYYLLRLLKGIEIGNLPVNEVISTYDIHFASEDFLVILSYIEDTDDIFFEKNERTLAGENCMIARFIIENVAEELIKEKAQPFMVRSDSIITCIVSRSEQTPLNFKNEIVSTIKWAQQYIRQQFNICFKTSVSTVHQTLISLHDAYEEALEGLEYMRIMPGSEIICYDEMKISSRDKYYYPLEKEQQLINFIKAADYNNAKRIFADVLEKNFSEPVLPVGEAKCLMLDLVSTMIKIANDINNMTNDFVFERDPIERLLRCDNIGKIRDEISDIIDRFCKNIELKERKGGSNLANSIIEFIQKNYQDENLNISYIANNFNMNANYLSSFFKQHTGQSLLDCIHKVRIEAAKRLLDEGTDMLENVSKVVGYSNMKTFTRIFTKFEGVTPGKYRNI